MNREIKFRGKRTDNGEWVYGDLLHVKDKTHILFSDKESRAKGCLKNYLVISDTVGQYTGLKDKNGKEICEGDIVAENGNIIGSIVFSSRYGVSIRKNSTKWSLLNFCLDSDFDCGTLSNIEVIGNIHNNPELMKGGSNEA